MARRTRQGGARGGRHMGMRDGRRFGRGGKIARGNMSVIAPDSGFVDYRRDTTMVHDHEPDIVNTSVAGISKAKTTIKLRAVVDPQVCTVCGICQDICPRSAITVDTIAHVDTLKCTGCGLCTTECPQGALTLREM